MLTATKEFKWEMAHLLDGHKGLCKNLHGHSYKMEVTVSRRDKIVCTAGPSEGMVIDFSDLKRTINNLLIADLDHAVMLNARTEDFFERELIKLCDDYGKKYYLVGYRPTAENMARDFYCKIKTVLSVEHSALNLESIRIYETATSCAEYTERC